jgi:HSP20 family molecular chaperone IbpA
MNCKITSNDSHLMTAFERAISFPEEVDPAKVKGTMKNGVLKLNVPKKEARLEGRGGGLR